MPPQIMETLAWPRKYPGILPFLYVSNSGCGDVWVHLLTGQLNESYIKTSPFSILILSQMCHCGNYLYPIEYFGTSGLVVPQSMLLYGPPGTSSLR